MRVAVLGSWRSSDQHQWGLQETLEGFQQAAKDIGHALIERGHSLILGATSLNTADGNALQGAVRAWEHVPGLRKDRPRVMMIRALPTKVRSEAAPAAYIRLQDLPPGLAVDNPAEVMADTSLKLVQAHYADAMILLGGAEKTEQAGLAATVARKPLACIGSFGGAAHGLNRMLAPNPWRDEDGKSHEWAELQMPYDQRLLGLALKRIGVEQAPKLMIIHGRSPDRDKLKRYLAPMTGRVVVLADEFEPTESIPLKFEREAASVDGAIALVTGDDVGGLGNGSEPLVRRARENVWVEVGWFWGRRGRSKLLLLVKDGANIPSDLGNVEVYRYDGTPFSAEVKAVIRRFVDRLRSASDRE